MNESPQKNISMENSKEIIFDEQDRENINDLHHDGLVINLYIINHFIRRILVDRGSSVNILGPNRIL